LLLDLLVRRQVAKNSPKTHNQIHASRKLVCNDRVMNETYFFFLQKTFLLLFVVRGYVERMNKYAFEWNG
jgi:hypothetical protein